MSKPVDLRPRPLNLTSPVNLPKTFRLQFRRGDEPVVYESVELWIGGGVGEDKGDAITVTAVPAEAPGDWWVTMPALPAQSGESLRLVLNGTVSTAGSLRTSVRAGDADETVAVLVGETTVIVDQVGPPGPPGGPGTEPSSVDLAAIVEGDG